MHLKSKKIILGIDPGTSILGFGVIKIENKKTELIELDVLMLKKISSHEERLKRIFDKTTSSKVYAEIIDSVATNTACKAA